MYHFDFTTEIARQRRDGLAREALAHAARRREVRKAKEGTSSAFHLADHRGLAAVAVSHVDGR
jgi:hypothetical protein